MRGRGRYREQNQERTGYGSKYRSYDGYRGGGGNYYSNGRRYVGGFNQPEFGYGDYANDGYPGKSDDMFSSGGGRASRRYVFDREPASRYENAYHHRFRPGTNRHECDEDVVDDNDVRRQPATLIPDDYNLEEIRSQMKSDMNYERYGDIEMEMIGNNKPPEMKNFRDAGLHLLVENAIKRNDYKMPTPIQRGCIPVILAGRDIIACAQTGSGKTAAFLLPIISRIIQEDKPSVMMPPNARNQPKVVICGPTRELVDQISQHASVFLVGTDFRVVVNYGGTLVKHVLNDINQGCDILIATPGRLHDHVKNGYLDLRRTKFFVLDEADRMLSAQNGFRDVVNYVINHFDQVPQISLLSATMSPEVRSFADEILTDYIYLQVGLPNAANFDVVQEVYNVDDKLDYLNNKLKDMSRLKVLVFAERKDTADFLGLSYTREGIWPKGKVLTLHGDRTQEQRNRALSIFRSLEVGALFATSVAARGLDIPKIDVVVNYDMPKSINDYVHRVGRTGRCGNVGRAVTFFDPKDDMEVAADLLAKLEECQQEVPPFLRHCVSKSRRSVSNGGRRSAGVAPGRISKGSCGYSEGPVEDGW